jgi:CheY-like chemotaxis protein
MIGGEDLSILPVTTGSEAMEMLAHQSFDGVIVDLLVKNNTSDHFIEDLYTQQGLRPHPTILFGEIPEHGDAKLTGLLQTGIVRHVTSKERLLDQTVLLMHREEALLSAKQRAVLADVRRRDATLAGRKVLVIDDDLRNIFALTSLLEHHDIEVLHAENGRAGIELLKHAPDVDVILMDIMMPEMDGYETTQAIRQIPAFQNLPIIALTAKAMKGDRDKCLEAGATDYVTKPVDLEQLFSVMRVWISRRYEDIPATFGSRS